MSFLHRTEPLPFGFVSVHAPTKRWPWDEQHLTATFDLLPSWIDAVVVHPDVIQDPALYERFGPRIAVENMDPRKRSGRTAQELAPIFEQLPNARLCFDVAHSAAIDPTLEDAGQILDLFGDRISHVHVSQIDSACRHQPLEPENADRFAPVLERLAHLPWVLEA